MQHTEPAPITLKRLDHLVLTVADVEKTVAFYTKVLGMKAVMFHGTRHALVFGGQKINLHEKGHEWEPKAEKPTPGSADLCFVTDDTIENVEKRLKALNVPIETGPVQRTGALGPILSVYIRDPDQNLIEISHYLASIMN